jgi:hypothetical protein
MLLQRRCAPSRGSASRHSPEYFNKEIVVFGTDFTGSVRDYDWSTVRPGAAMTVKEMGPAIGASSPALFMCS